MWKEIRETTMWLSLVTGFVIMMRVAFLDIPDKQNAMDLGFRVVRMGAAFAIFPLDAI